MLWLVTEVGIRTAMPGVKASEVYQAMAAMLEEGGVDVSSNNVGRMGHGLGMQLTEWPSIHPDDHTVLEEGMVMTIEPGLGLADGTMLAHEENIVIRSTGAELLTVRASGYIPVVRTSSAKTEVRYSEGARAVHQHEEPGLPPAFMQLLPHVSSETKLILKRMQEQLHEVEKFHNEWTGRLCPGGGLVLNGAQPSKTPLIMLPSVAEGLGLKHVWLKDEGKRWGLKAFKGLGCSWAVERLRSHTHTHAHTCM